MVGILLSYWGGLFSGATLVSGRVAYFQVRTVSCRALKKSVPCLSSVILKTGRDLTAVLGAAAVVFILPGRV